MNKMVMLALGVSTLTLLSACNETDDMVSAGPGNVPAFSASCPNLIEVNSDGSGPVYINAQQAAVQKFNDNFYEAMLGDVTASISVNPDRSVSVSYNKRSVGNGVCTMNT